MWVPDGQDQLFTVNPATGSTTLVGHFGFNPNMDWIDALAFDPSTDTLFGVSNLNVLYSINQATGAATVIASTHHFSPFSALACDNSGTLFGETGDDIMGRPALVEINKTTGAITVRAHLATDVNDIAVRPEDNVMFGTMPGSAGNASLYTINPTTGAMTFVGRTGAGVTGVSGLAFSALPEPVSSSALALAGVALMRRRSLRRR
jgi:sugar lactone lactonase YvrE